MQRTSEELEIRLGERSDGRSLCGKAIGVVTAVVTAVIQRSRLGRMLQGMSASTTGVTSMGLSVNVSLTAARGRDATVLSLGEALEAAFDGEFANRIAGV